MKHGFHIGIRIVSMDCIYGARLRAEPRAKGRSETEESSGVEESQRRETSRCDLEILMSIELRNL